MRFSLKTWYMRQSWWVGWLGILLIAATFVCKEVLPEHFKSSSEEVERAISILDTDEQEVRQNSDRTQFEPYVVIQGEPSGVPAMLQKIFRAWRLSAQGGFYWARIERLSRSDEVAESGFLAKEGQSVQGMKAEVMTINQEIQKWEENEKNTEAAIEAKKLPALSAVALIGDALQEDRNIDAFEKKFEGGLDNWEKAQRQALERKNKSLKTKATIWSIVSYIVFFIGWMIIIADKATGRPQSELKAD